MNADDFAKKLGVANFTVQRYLLGRVPAPDVLAAIVRVTKGNVQPNDFYNLK